MKTLMNKAVLLISTLILTVAMFPCVAKADTGLSKAITQDEYGVVIVDGARFKPETRVTLPSGNYHLETDVSQTFFTDGNVKLDLNGHKMDSEKSACIYVKTGELTICNTASEAGIITNSSNGIGIEMNAKTSLSVLRGVEITGNKKAGISPALDTNIFINGAKITGNGFGIRPNGNVKMADGIISENEYGVMLFPEMKFEFLGGQIVDNKSNLTLYNGAKVVVSGPLGGSAKIGVSHRDFDEDTPITGAFLEGWENTNGQNPALLIFSDDEAYGVTLDKDGNVVLADKSTIAEEEKKQEENKETTAESVKAQDELEPKVVGTKFEDAEKAFGFVVTSADKANPTVDFRLVNNKKVKTVVVPQTVKFEGVTYKVTGVATKAFNGCKRLTKITLGKDIENIRANAFKGAGKLSKINIKSAKLTKSSLDKKAFKSVKDSVVVKVPKNMKKTYARLFTKKGLSKKVVVK